MAKKAAKKPARPAKSVTKSSSGSKAARKVIKKKPVEKPVARKAPASKSAGRSANKPAAKAAVTTTTRPKPGTPAARSAPKTVSKAAIVPVAKVGVVPVAKPAKITRPVAVVVAAAVAVDEARKKGVRKATLTSGIRDDDHIRRLGRSRIPVDAPLEVVFQNDTQAREAFMFLAINSIRDLEHFTPDELVLRLTGPAKLTVGRIRKILAMNNRCLSGDEKFALEFQDLLSRPRE